MAFKTLLLASALAFGGTAIAQDTTTTTSADPAAQTQPMTPAPTDPAAPPPTDTTTTPPAGSTMSPTTQPAPMPNAPMNQTPTGQAPMGQTPMTAPDGFQGKESSGGYMPANPPMAGMAQPGQQVQFVPAPPVAQAYPAPAPLQSYPICKKGQTDKCRQRGG